MSAKERSAVTADSLPGGSAPGPIRQSAQIGRASADLRPARLRAEGLSLREIAKRRHRDRRGRPLRRLAGSGRRGQR